MSKRKKIHTIEDAVKLSKKTESEAKELRSLWEENERDIIQLNAIITRFLKLKWYQRLFIKWDDRRLYTDE